MSLFSKIKDSVVLGYVEGQLYGLGKPYGVKRVKDLETRSGGAFAVTVELTGDSPLRITGTVRFPPGSDEVRIQNLNTGRHWLDLVADKHLLNKPLPLTPDQVAKLKTLWPD